MEPRDAAATVVREVPEWRRRVRARFLAEVRRLDGYIVEALTDAGDDWCVAIWRHESGGRYLVMREIGFDEWEHD